MTAESPIVLCKFCARPISGDPVRYRGECYHRRHWQLAKPDNNTD